MRAWLMAVLGLGLLGGCEEKISRSDGQPKTGATAVAKKAKAPTQESAPRVEFQQSEFAESGRSRDPFRSFQDLIVAEVRGSLRSQRNVVLNEYSVEELRLIGIVTRIHPAKAMLVDPKGRGHVVERGQFIGRPEIIQTPGPRSSSFEINWRIDSIREGDIVLVREDPNNPDVPSSTRVLALRPEGEAEQLLQ